MKSSYSNHDDHCYCLPCLRDVAARKRKKVVPSTITAPFKPRGEYKPKAVKVQTIPQMISKSIKTCVKCKVTKQLSKFYHNIKSPDGVENICKECKKSRRRKLWAEQRKLGKRV